MLREFCELDAVQGSGNTSLPSGSLHSLMRILVVKKAIKHINKVHTMLENKCYGKIRAE